MPSTRDKLTFVAAMSRATSATVRQCEALMRYGATLWLLERDHSLASIAKRERIRGKVTELCREIPTTKEFQLIQTLYQALMNETPVGIRSDEKRMAAQFLKDAPVTYVETCIPVFMGAKLTIRVPGGEAICVPS